jgi:hypothetical protein
MSRALNHYTFLKPEYNVYFTENIIQIKLAEKNSIEFTGKMCIVSLIYTY